MSSEPQNVRDYRRLATKFAESIQVLASSMQGYEAGHRHLYLAMAAQLRCLFCDTCRKRDNSLFHRLLPDGRLLAFQEIVISGWPLGFGSFPFTITKRQDGVVICDFHLTEAKKHLTLQEWRCQELTRIPRPLTVQEIIRSVCDKDGGAHVDDDVGLELGSMMRSGPIEGGLHVPFTVGLTRYAIRIGRVILWKHAHQWGLGDIRFYVPPPPPPAIVWEAGPVTMTAIDPSD